MAAAAAEVAAAAAAAAAAVARRLRRSLALFIGPAPARCDTSTRPALSALGSPCAAVPLLLPATLITATWMATHTSKNGRIRRRLERLQGCPAEPEPPQ